MARTDEKAHSWEKLLEDIRPWCFECPLDDCCWSGPAESCPYARGEKEAPASMLEGDHPARVSIITDRPGNPYRPWSKLWRLYQEDFSGWSAHEIADQIGSTVDSVWTLMRKVYKDTGYDMPYRRSPGHERERKPWKPREPKKPKRTLTWALQNEDFSKLTVPEIAAMFDTTECGVRCAMMQIYKGTGWRVPYVHREAGRKRGK